MRHIFIFSIYSCIFYILFIYLFFFFSGDRVSLCHPDWSAVVQSRLTETSASGFKQFSCLSLLTSQVAGITRAHHHAQLISVFLVEMGFHYVGQAGLKLLTS
uniref:Uncharacterized protein n=1 Tax=Papio anubis TaxID=9555 RepID=A0A8I5N0J8_PAPAN